MTMSPVYNHSNRQSNSSCVPEKLRDRTWYEKDGAYAFLVDAPHTFGHSQLVVTVRGVGKEENSFSTAARHIVGCIKRLRMSLPKPDDPNWKALARYTRTSGPYKKMLLFRVSANEKRNEYKVHLVPYFKSHLDATNRLYRATHNKGPRAKGGLLHWLGLREVILDYDMRDGRNSKVVQSRIKAFRLQLLASKLREDMD
jgi:hypothetical protein